MTEYSRMAKGKFTSTGAAQIIQLPFQPDYVELLNYSVQVTPAADRMVRAYWDVNMGQGINTMEIFNGATAYTTDSVSSNGISTFSAGQLLQYGPTMQIASTTKASPTVVTTASAHGLSSGDVVILVGLYQSATTGMAQISNIPFTITRTGATTFTIPWDSTGSNYTALSASPTGAFVKKVLYPYLYFPGVSIISAITDTTPGSVVTIDTTSAHNLVVGQEVAFHVPSIWGTTQLNELNSITTPSSPVYGYVISVTDYNTVLVSITHVGFTAFVPNQPMSGVPGEQLPQMIAVGDVNTGGVQISSGSALYPPPYYVPIGTTRVNTINGPAIQGSFVNNTSQGFIVGSGVGATDSTVVLAGASGNVIYWRAFLHDISIP
jgi:hypothetical protein